LNHCMDIKSYLDVEPERRGSGFMFSLLTPDRTYYFSSDNKQLTQNWVEIISNACSQHIHFKSKEVKKETLKVQEQGKKPIKDPYIHLTECFSGEKKPPNLPPRPAKSSSDIKKQLSMDNFGDDDIDYLDLEFSPEKSRDTLERSDTEEKIVYRNIDFVKTKAFNATRREVEKSRYNFSH